MVVMTVMLGELVAAVVVMGHDAGDRANLFEGTRLR